MGGFLIVHGERAARGDVRSLFELGVKSYSRLKGMDPLGIREAPDTSVAKYGRIAGPTTGIAEDGETGSWLISMGTVLLQGASGRDLPGGLLERYLAKGERLTEDLDGFFVIAVYDARERKLIVITDRLGSCHAYVHFGNDKIVLSSSSWVTGALLDQTLDLKSCYEFLTTGTIFENRTLFRAVKKLAPATVYCFSGGALRSQREYWELRSLPINSLEGEGAVDRLSESLIATARQVHGSYGRVLCDLTGGYDSRAVLATEIATGETFSTVVNGSPDDLDVLIANRIASTFGLSHRHNAPSSDWPEKLYQYLKEAHRLTDGEYDLLEYAATFRNHALVSREFDLSINGSGGEVARGYWWELLFPNTGRNSRIDLRKVASKRFAVVASDQSVFSGELKFDLVDHFTGILEKENHAVRHLPNTTQMDHTYLRLRMQRWQGRIASSTNQIWPCLSLFLCRGPLEVSLCTVPSTRRRSLMVRMMLERVNPQLASLPLENGCPALPVRLANVHRFHPLAWTIARKVVRKILRRNVWKTGTARKENQNNGALRSIWKEDEVRELVEISKMKTAGFYETGELRKFLMRSQGSGFQFVGQFGRILTLERTIRQLGQSG